jgi:DNA-binding XRE family transcriptional regulator
MKLTLREKFLAKVSPRADGCWLWTGLIRPDGYGATRFEGKEQGAHRVAWKLFRGRVAPGLAVCHKCDVRACVNPAHLFLGTPAENARDMRAKGRDRRGEKHGSAKLTRAQVHRIKEMLAEDRMYMSEIAREFGVSQTTIRAIKTGRTWREVGGGHGGSSKNKVKTLP